MRYDLAFFLCCCKSFLGSSNNSSTEPGKEDFYDILEIDRDAAPDEIKRAYKRKSLQMHPDKLAQRGKKVTMADQARFQRMKEAYETLSDSHRRETYDAIGEKGMKWLDEPFSLDPQELAHNFANSSAIDRSKIFLIFVTIIAAVFLLPILMCLQVDRKLGYATWIAILTPLWIWNALILFYHLRVIMMGPISRPENIPEADWIDPLPMSKRVFSLMRFSLIILFEVLVALRLDSTIQWKWLEIFIPIYIWEGTTLYKKLPIVRMRIVTIEDLEAALGKPFSEFTQAEKDLISRRYSVVPSVESPEFEAAHKLKSRARQDVIKVGFRLVFLVFLLIQLDAGVNWNWWLIFSPFWIMSICICCGSYQAFVETQAAAAEKDPDLFNLHSKLSGLKKEEDDTSGNIYDTMNGQPPKKITEEERAELKAQLAQSGYRMISSCCSQAFILLIACLFVGKVQGASYSSVWIISPLLFVAGTILLCLGCTIFCITEVSDDDILHDSSKIFGIPVGTDYEPPEAPPRTTTMKGLSGKRQPHSTWDPEKGQIWVDTFSSEQTSSSQNEELPTLKQQQLQPISTNTTTLNVKDTISEISQKQNEIVDLLDINTIEKPQIVPANSDDYHDLD